MINYYIIGLSGNKRKVGKPVYDYVKKSGGEVFTSESEVKKVLKEEVKEPVKETIKEPETKEVEVVKPKRKRVTKKK